VSKEKPKETQCLMPVKGESASAYGAFCVYRDLGVGRKITQVARILGETPGEGPNYDTVRTWSINHDWESRILEYDASLSAERAKAETSAIRKSVAKVQAELLNRLRMNLQLTDKLRERAAEMLDYPLCKEVRQLEPQVSKDGKTTIIQHVYEPTKWSTSDIPKYLEVAMKMDKEALLGSDAQVANVGGDAKDAAAEEMSAFRKKQMEAIERIPSAPPLPPGGITNPIDVTGDDGAE
jgi:hypothetical protein